MAKILNTSFISGVVPKMLEIGDSFIINGQAHDKMTLEPKKFETIQVNTDHSKVYMNTQANLHKRKQGAMYSDNNVIIDKFDPSISYTLISENDTFIATKFTKVNDMNSLTVRTSKSATECNCTFFSQDVNYLYVNYVETHTSYIGRIDKSTMTLQICNVGSSYSQITLLKDTPLFIYYALSREYDKFYIGKYVKNSNSNTNFFSDIGTVSRTEYTWSEPLSVSENEVIVLRNNMLFDANNHNKIIIKKYVIDYYYDKVYSREIDFDCSYLPTGLIPVYNSSSYYTVFKSFDIGDQTYYSIWNRGSRDLFLAKKISDSQISIIQQYELPKLFTGAIPYNNGKILIFYDTNSLNFVSFSEFEEKFEETNSLAGTFSSLGIDRNKIVWLQHSDNSVDTIGVNIPTSTEVEFQDIDLNYINEDIESYLNVYAKNFNGKLVQANIEVILNGPVVFSDTKKQKKTIRTMDNSVSKIPITIVNSGMIEASSIIN